MLNFLKKLYVISLLTFILIYFISSFSNISAMVINNTLSAFGLIMVITLMLTCSKKEVVVPCILICVSLLSVWGTYSDPIALWQALREMKAVIPVIILISLIGWIIGHRPYVKALMIIGKKRITTPLRFFAFVTFISHITSSFMNVGGIPFVYQMFSNEKKNSVSQLAWDYTLSTAIMRGFALTVLWATVHPAFAYVLSGTKAHILLTIVMGLGLTCIGIIISTIIYKVEMKHKHVPPDITPEISIKLKGQHKGLIMEFLFWVLLLVVGIFVSNMWLGLNILISIPLITFVVTTLYFIINRSISTYKQLWFHLITVNLDNKRKEVLLILSVGLLVGTLKETGNDQVLFAYFLNTIDWLNINILIGLTFLVLILGLCGFTPVPATILLSGLVVNIPDVYSPELIALSILLGVTIITVSSPVTVPLLLISSLNQRSVLENGTKWNLMYALPLLIIGILYIQILAFIYS